MSGLKIPFSWKTTLKAFHFIRRQIFFKKSEYRIPHFGKPGQVLSNNWTFRTKKAKRVQAVNSPVLSTCRRHSLGLCLALSVCTLLACSNEEDKLAKKRIFSQEDPPLAVAAAREVLQAGALATKAELVPRILGMGIAETTERLGAHQFTATLRMEWAGNKQKHSLTEERLLLSAPGGVLGDFYARLRNGRGQGYEVLRVGHQVFAKNQYGTYRQRLRDRGMAERMRQEAFGVLGDMDRLFGQRLQLRSEGKEEIEGRQAHTFQVALAASPRVEKGRRPLPPKLSPRRELSESSRLRLGFFERRLPETLEGKLWVDASTAVVLRADIRGTLKVPEEAGADSLVSIYLQARMSHIGQNPQLAIPETFIPDEDKPQGIAAALERFGLGRKSRAEADSPTEELPDEEE